MQKQIESILAELGEDPKREGLLKTPERVEKSLKFLTRGYHQTLDEVVNGALFEAESDDMVIVRDIDPSYYRNTSLLRTQANWEMAETIPWRKTSSRNYPFRSVQPIIWANRDFLASTQVFAPPITLGRHGS